MGRPLNKKFFGFPTNPGISIQFTSCWVPGETGPIANAYVVKQTGTNSYLAENPTTGNSGIVTLAPAATAAGLAALAVSTALPGTGSGASLSAVMGASHATAAGGTGNVVGDTLTVVGGTGTAATFSVATVDGGGAVLTVTVKTAGAYSVLPAGALATTSSGAGTGATVTITGYKVVSFSSVNPGSNYANPSISLPGGATGTPTLSGGAITGATVGSAGDNYTSIPSVTISDSSIAQHAKKIMAIRVLTFEGGAFSWKSDNSMPDATFASLSLV